MDCQATWSLTATPCGSAFVVDFAARRLCRLAALPVRRSSFNPIRSRV